MLTTLLSSFTLKNRQLLPIVQGGMGVGVSAHRLAGTVAALGGMGTISSVDLRRHHPDLMAQTGKSHDKELLNRANLTALDREVRAAKQLAGDAGAVHAAHTLRQLGFKDVRPFAGGFDAWQELSAQHPHLLVEA